MKKWRAPRFQDQLELEHGIYVFADRPDEFGPRAFMTLNLMWEDHEVSFLSDAATPWGMAPWALFNAQEGMRVKTLGSWAQMVAVHAKSMSLTAMAARESNSPIDCGGLMLVRCALRIESLARGKDVGVDVARHCLRQEIERDAMIREAKAKRYAIEHPDWRPPKPRAAQSEQTQ